MLTVRNVDETGCSSNLYRSKRRYCFNIHDIPCFLGKTILLFCLRAVFSRSGQVDLSFSKDNGVHTVLLNGSLQSPVLSVSYLTRLSRHTNECWIR